MHQQHPLTSEIIALIEQRAGLVLRELHRQADTQRAIKTTIAELGIGNIETLYNMLLQHESQHPVWQTMLQLLTVGETYFFRNQAHFNALRDDVLPQLIARKRELNHRWLRIWSAGCATGEEIYSVAILLRELLPDYRDWLIYLIGTDINEAYLEQARHGVYRINSFRGETPENLRQDWFTQHGNTYKLDASIRNSVIFQILNLVTDKYPSPDATLQSMDIIMCQNVTIYFEREVTERVQLGLIDTLAEDGWLILGHSEPLYIKSPHLSLRNFTNAVLFQRQQPPIVAPEPKQRQLPPVKPARPAPPPKRITSLLPTLKQTQEVQSADEMCRLAREAADNQQWSEAFSLLDKLIQLHPLHEYAHYLRGLIHIERQEFAKALHSLRQALYCNSNFILARYTLGELYQRMGHTQQALREWQMTQRLLTTLEPESLIPYSTDLSVEMLHGVLELHLRNGGMRA